jgi:hypothetical protein
MARKRNGFDQTSVLMYALAGIAVFLVARKVTQGASTVGGYLNPLTAEAVQDIPFDKQVILSKNPRFATEGVADRAYAITRLGGKVVDPLTYPYTIVGFQQYLDASGVNRQYSSAYELAKMNKPAIGAKYGYTLFLPPQIWWPKGAALALLQNRLRELVGEPVVINNWWRPKGYNEDPGVGGAPNGDHPDGDALDLNFRSAAAKWKACEFMYDLQQSEPTLKVSLGIYGSGGVLHKGLQSAKGKRSWDSRKGKGVGITRATVNEGLRSGVA